MLGYYIRSAVKTYFLITAKKYCCEQSNDTKVIFLLVVDIFIKTLKLSCQYLLTLAVIFFAVFSKKDEESTVKRKKNLVRHNQLDLLIKRLILKRVILMKYFNWRLIGLHRIRYYLVKSIYLH